MSLWALLGAPLVEVLLLVGISTYLGLHILRRGIIFVDLALAQIAALGGLVAFLVGLDHAGIGASIYALVFAFVGGGLFALLRQRPGSQVPQEALIGLVYASAAALALLLMARAPEGAEHLRETLTGTLLWVDWWTVLEAAVIVAIAAVVHLLSWRRMLELAEPLAGGRGGLLWDFVFYATFALVVTHAVRTAGVLLVFVLLVAPAALAVNLARRLRDQLLIGWSSGVAVCVLGMALSYQLDLPVAPAVVTVYAALLLGVGIWRWLRAGRGLAQLAWVGATLLAAGAALLGTRLLAAGPHSHLGHAHGSHVEVRAPHAHAPPEAVREGDRPSQGQAPGDPDHDRDQHRAGLSIPATVPADQERATSTLLTRMEAQVLPDDKRAICATVEHSGLLVRALDRASQPFDRLALALCLRERDPGRGVDALKQLAADPGLPELARLQVEAALAAEAP